MLNLRVPGARNRDDILFEDPGQGHLAGCSRVLLTNCFDDVDKLQDLREVIFPEMRQCKARVFGVEILRPFLQ